MHLAMRMSKTLPVNLSHVSIYLTRNRLWPTVCTNIGGISGYASTTALVNGAELSQLYSSTCLTQRQVTATLYKVTWRVLRFLLDGTACRYTG
jgi:hypothetical protein